MTIVWTSLEADPTSAIDAPRRPGVAPTRQKPSPTSVFTRTGIDPPFFSNAFPPRLLSGALRRAAYQIPDHRARLADRVEALERPLSTAANVAAEGEP